MKKLIVAGAMALGFLSASAQTKIGYINTEEVMAAMPETQKASKELQELQETLGKQYEELEKESNEKTAQFIKDSATYNPTMREIKREEVIKLITRVQNFNNEAKERAQKAQQEKFAPIQQKAMDAIKAAAKKNGYAYVLDITAILVAPPADDILSLVKKELGIVDAPKTPAKTATPPAKQ